MKRNAPDFTSGQFFALRRGADLAAATGEGPAQVQGLPPRVARLSEAARNVEGGLAPAIAASAWPGL